MPEDEDKKAILSRRNRLVAIALSGLASASTGCYEAHVAGGEPPPTVDAGMDSSTPTPCLGIPFEPDAGFDSGVVIPGPCLSAPADAAPTPCLDVDPDAMVPGDAGTDAEPAPCLTII